MGGQTKGDRERVRGPDREREGTRRAGEERRAQGKLERRKGAREIGRVSKLYNGS